MIRLPPAPITWHGRLIAFRISTYYARGGVKIELVDRGTWERLATATVEYLPGVKLGRNEVLVNDMNETYGLVEILERAGLIMQTGTILEHYGYRAYHCVLTEGITPRAGNTQWRLL